MSIGPRSTSLKRNQDDLIAFATRFTSDLFVEEVLCNPAISARDTETESKSSLRYETNDPSVRG